MALQLVRHSPKGDGGSLGDGGPCCRGGLGYEWHGHFPKDGTTATICDLTLDSFLDKLGNFSFTMCHMYSEIIKTLFQALVSVGTTLLAFYLGRKSALKDRGMASLYAIADMFANEAVIWSEKAYQVDGEFRAFHALRRKHLKAHIDYVTKYHPKRWELIREHWLYFYCDVPLTEGSYLNKDQQGFVEALHRIADLLRSE